MDQNEPGDLRRLSTASIVAIAAVGTVTLALSTASQVYLSMATHGHSFIRILAWQLGAWGLWAIATPGLLRLAQRGVRLRVLVPLGIVVVLAHVLIAALLTMWVRPFAVDGLEDFPYPFSGGVSLSVPYVALIDPVLFILVVVAGRALAAHEQTIRMQLRESQLESDLARAQLDALRLEIEPHFLFNTLNSIAALIRLENHKGALAMLLSLSELMRTTLDRAAGQYTSLDQELTLVSRYVDLQRTRFNDRLTVVYAVDPVCADVAIPAFLLQPIVENALRHGLMPRPAGGRLEIGAACGDTGIRIWVKDDGIGLTPSFDLQQCAGTGLRNVRARLQRIYGPRASFSIRTGDAGGTISEVVLPAAVHVTAVPA
jgi:two-component system LytT family sensor kinase